MRTYELEAKQVLANIELAIPTCAFKLIESADYWEIWIDGNKSKIQLPFAMFADLVHYHETSVALQGLSEILIEELER